MQFLKLLFFSPHEDQLCGSILPYLGIISSALSLTNLRATFDKKVRTVAVQKRDISEEICGCLHYLTSNFLIQPLLTPIHPFLYAHIGFWILGIPIRPNWNNYNITNVPTTLRLNQMKQICSSYYFLHLFINSPSQHVYVIAIFIWMQVSLFGRYRDNL